MNFKKSFKKSNKTKLLWIKCLIKGWLVHAALANVVLVTEWEDCLRTSFVEVSGQASHDIFQVDRRIAPPPPHPRIPPVAPR